MRQRGSESATPQKLSGSAKVQAKGYTIDPTGAPTSSAVAPKLRSRWPKSKQEWDKRQSLREAQDKREAERAMRAYAKRPAVAYR